MTKGLWIIPGLLVLAACGKNDSVPENRELRSDMPARMTKYYLQHRDELAEMDKICGAWRASQRPPASWPAVVIGNCNSVNAAKTSISNGAETDKLRKEAGI
ncbi:hypothetical protein [Novosphingobium soli]|jgi:hypothetical protein|uniref:EexN family lipoprotein n=1 Tax=Novosphingobium soli TaxID=574956 RepID=A0ABV6D1G9_9SPHN